jgi:hypothetical protein
MRKPILFLATLVSIMWPATTHAGASPEKAFQKLQSLAGDWEGIDDKGNVVRTTFKLVVSGTALLETFHMSGIDEMLTVYSIDKDGIALLHYCPTNNQPHMRAIPPEGQVQELVFQFQGAGNLPNLDVGHEHKLVIQFVDGDRIVERWTWRGNGHDTETAYRLVRKLQGAE